MSEDDLVELAQLLMLMSDRLLKLEAAQLALTAELRAMRET